MLALRYLSVFLLAQMLLCCFLYRLLATTVLEQPHHLENASTANSKVWTSGEATYFNIQRAAMRDQSSLTLTTRSSELPAIPALLPFRCEGNESWLDGCQSRCVAGDGAVPRFVHFVLLNDEFGFLHWIAVMAALKFVRPQRVLLFASAELTSCWATRALSNPVVQMQFVPASAAPKRVRSRRVTELAHKSDFLRLSALWQFGGVYIDTDAIVTKPFDELLYKEAVVARQFGNVTVGNGLIVARKHSCFICTFARASCANFDGRWNTHSVKTLAKLLAPGKASGPFMRSVRVLKHAQGFFPFGWKKAPLGDLFNNSQVDFRPSDVFAIHLYNSKARKHGYLKLLTFDWLRRSGSVVASVLRLILPAGFEEQHFEEKPCRSLPPFQSEKRT